MSKKTKTRQSKKELQVIRNKLDAGEYGHVLDHMRQPAEDWELKAPRLTESEKQKLQRITRGIFMKWAKVTPDRRTFEKIHERMEEEIYDKVRSQMGLKAKLEWRITFNESAQYYFAKLGMQNPGYVDGVSPTTDFLESDLFDYVLIFKPVVSVQQFDEYSKYMDSTEASIKQAEKRREAGDAYFTKLDKDINYRAPVAPGDED